MIKFGGSPGIFVLWKCAVWLSRDTLSPRFHPGDKAPKYKRHFELRRPLADTTLACPPSVHTHANANTWRIDHEQTCYPRKNANILSRRWVSGYITNNPILVDPLTADSVIPAMMNGKRFKVRSPIGRFCDILEIFFKRTRIAPKSKCKNSEWNKGNEHVFNPTVNFKFKLCDVAQSPIINIGKPTYHFNYVVWAMFPECQREICKWREEWRQEM